MRVTMGGKLKLVPGQFPSVGLDIRGAGGGGGEPDRDENLQKGSFLALSSSPLNS